MPGASKKIRESINKEARHNEMSKGYQDISLSGIVATSKLAGIHAFAPPYSKEIISPKDNVLDN